MQIAIDGPAGSGKSTIAKMLADKRGYIYLDTGAMYRAAAFMKLLTELDYSGLSQQLSAAELVFTNNGKSLAIKYPLAPELRDVSAEIRTPEVTAMVSEVAANPEIRAILTEKQREIAANHDVIMDGRDIGTVVLPKADVKVFLTASPEVRARRRLLEWESKGEKLDYEKVLADIIERDRLDSTRETAPLKKADDAVELDTSDMTIAEVADKISSMIDSK